MFSAEAQASPTDAALMAGLRSRDQDSMARLYDRHAPVVYAVALRVLGDTGTAEEVLQDVFMQLWRKPDSFDASRGVLGAWLAVIARHRAVDYLRRRRPETDIADAGLSLEVNLGNETEKRVAIGKIRAALSGMPAEQRKPLEMAFFEGLTHNEIAERTGEPLGTIKTRIRAGLIALRKAFAT